MNFPSKCPHCGKDIVKNEVGRIPDKDVYTDIRVIWHRCRHCNESFFIIEKFNDNNFHIPEIIQQIPPAQVSNYPKQVKDLSPTAFKAFNQAIQAQGLGLNQLVGAGLRIALEWLVTDYLINIKRLTDNELKNLDLYKRIEKMDGDRYKLVCSHIIRKFGNGSVHILKQIDFNVDEVIELYKILVDIINTEITLIEAEKRLNQKS